MSEPTYQYRAWFATDRHINPSVVYRSSDGINVEYRRNPNLAWVESSSYKSWQAVCEDSNTWPSDEFGTVSRSRYEPATT